MTTMIFCVYVQGRNDVLSGGKIIIIIIIIIIILIIINGLFN